MARYIKWAGVPVSPINSVDKLFTDPQVEARNMLVEVEQPGVGKIKVAGNPIKYQIFHQRRKYQRNQHHQ